ncbi:MAG: DUF1698 domain-containing protein [Alphaproteobacteria bacterium]|nr:DUF1698 domain-containing protein [Alphaproteobacteria bacterium]
MSAAYTKYKSVFAIKPSGNDEVKRIQQEMDALDRNAQYGWGHTIDFGAFEKQGVLGDNYLNIIDKLDEWGWLKPDYSGAAIADIGCYTGGISAILASRNPRIVYGVDELPSHLEQCNYLAKLLKKDNIKTIPSSVYTLGQHIENASLDMILFSGVLYHMSDMLVGLYQLNQLLKVGGELLIETNAVDDKNRSYANFGRYHGGMWWQPSGVCLRDMCEFMGYKDVEVKFYTYGRCLVRAIKETEHIPYRCGVNWPFESRMDRKKSVVNELIMAPARSNSMRIKRMIRQTVRKIFGKE